MRVLAIDTSQIKANVCLIVDGKLIKSIQGSTSVAHSEALLNLVKEVISPSELHTVSAYAVGIGPGSFTGIRIGCATIKSFAQVYSKPVLPFSSLKALAFSATDRLENALCTVQAYQGLVFTGRQNAQGLWVEKAETIEDFFNESFKEYPNSSFLVAGNAYRFFKSKFDEAQKKYSGLKFLFDEAEFAQASGIMNIVNTAKNEEYLHYNQVHANYIRASQAEIKLESMLAQKTTSKVN